MIGNNADDSGTGTETVPMLSTFVPAFGPLLRVASALNWPTLSWSVEVITENIPSAAEPLIGVEPVYVQVRFKMLGLSVAFTNGGVGPKSACENVQPVGCVFEPGAIVPKS